MKTINKLKKEIEKMNKTSSLKKFIFTKVDGVDYVSKDVHEILELKAKLETLQEVCKEIKKVIFNIGAEQSDKHLQGMEIFEEELLKRFQGDSPKSSGAKKK